MRYKIKIKNDTYDLVTLVDDKKKAQKMVKGLRKIGRKAVVKPVYLGYKTWSNGVYMVYNKK